MRLVSSPILRPKISVPTLEDLINISSTDRFFGNSFMSEILYLEHLIDLGIFEITVSAETKLFSRASAIVKVLKIEPSS